MNLDRDCLPTNTPESRAARCNTPEWCDGLELETYPRELPLQFVSWLHPPPSSKRPRRGLVLYGPPGLGKTVLGVAALKTLAERGVGSTFQWNMVTAPANIAAVESGEAPREPSPCWFERFSHLLRLQRRQAWDEELWFEQLERVAALMLDDVGTEPGTPFRETFLLQHIEWMFDAKSTLIITLNPPPSKWHALLGERIADRLTDTKWFTVVPFAGGSLREPSDA